MSSTKVAIASVFSNFVLVALVAAAPPKVISASPDNGDESVDPATKVLRIKFDQDMDTGLSVCGIQEAQIAGKPHWKTKRVFEIPIKLQPDTNYAWSANCPSGTNFRNTAGEPAPIYPIRFTTASAAGKPTAPAVAPTVAEKKAAVDALRKAIDEHYAYRDLRRTDWDQIFDAYRSQLESAGSWGKFANVVAKLLSTARDVHITVRPPKGEALATFRSSVQPNYDFRQILQQVPKLKKLNNNVATGKYDDGIGYLLIGSWIKAEELEPVFAVLKEFANAPGLIIDVRPNAGGNELLAREVAGCFVREPVGYSKHAVRDRSQSSGFAEQQTRELMPNAKGPSLSMPVAVLMGPATMSSSESFLLMMRQAPNVELIGERSYGSSGNPQPHEIGGGIVVMLPSWQDFLPDGTLLEGRGVTPDVSVPAGAEDTSDAVLDVALARLRRK